MIIKISPKMLSIDPRSFNEKEKLFFKSYKVPECLTVSENFFGCIQFTGNKEHLFDFLLSLSFQFDIELI